MSDEKKSCLEVSPSYVSCFQSIMNLSLLLSIILVTELPSATFGKSSAAQIEAVGTEVSSARQTETHLPLKHNDDDSRTKQNSVANNDDFLINKLSRKYVTSNLLDSTETTSCNK